ncbi:MAG: cytochrome b6-f complex subunit PetL [Cyanobacteria bacterium P01_H01_bin.121]
MSVAGIVDYAVILAVAVTGATVLMFGLRAVKLI